MNRISIDLPPNSIPAQQEENFTEFGEIEREPIDLTPVPGIVVDQSFCALLLAELDFQPPLFLKRDSSPFDDTSIDDGLIKASCVSFSMFFDAPMRI